MLGHRGQELDESDALGVALRLTTTRRLEQADVRIAQFQRSGESFEDRTPTRVGDRRKELLEDQLLVIVDGLGDSAPSLKHIMSIDILEDSVDDRIPGHQWTEEGPKLSRHLSILEVDHRQLLAARRVSRDLACLPLDPHRDSVHVLCSCGDVVVDGLEPDLGRFADIRPLARHDGRISRRRGTSAAASGSGRHSACGLQACPCRPARLPPAHEVPKGILGSKGRGRGTLQRRSSAEGWPWARTRSARWLTASHAVQSSS